MTKKTKRKRNKMKKENKSNIKYIYSIYVTELRSWAEFKNFFFFSTLVSTGLEVEEGSRLDSELRHVAMRVFEVIIFDRIYVDEMICFNIIFMPLQNEL